MTTRAIQHGFMAGETSDDMGLRSDLKGLRYSAKTMLNWNSTLQGPAETRRSFTIVGAGRVSTIYPGRAYGFLSLFDSNDNFKHYQVDIYTTGIYVAEYAGNGLWDAQIAIATSITIPSGAFLGNITCLQPPGLDELWIFFEFDQAPLRLFFSTTWQAAAISWTTQPTDWTSTHYVRTACFFQSRLYVVSTGVYRHKFWGSKTDDFDNFTTGSLPADALEHELPSAGVIQWIAAAQNLVIGTDRAEYIVTAQEGVIIPGDIKVTQQDTNGSPSDSVAQSASKVFFITKNGRGVQSMGFEWTKEAWLTKDLMFASEHLTRDYTITKLVYYDYEDVLVALREDGKILRGAYDKINDIVGWSVWEHGIFPNSQEPIFYSLDVGPVACGEASLVAHVAYVSAASTTQIQLFAQLGDYSNTFDDAGLQAVDALLDFVKIASSLSTPFSSVTSNSLANRTGLTAIIDGVIYKDQSFSGSTYTMPVSGNLCLIGIPITDDLLEIKSPVQISDNQESTHGVLKRWARIFTRVVNSYTPKINGRAAMNTIKETKDIKMNTLGWDKEKVTTFEHNSPYRSKVAGIFGVLGQGEL